mmetsp:Transcript_12944/g.24322  ORF Transcript_12944/g.24322 Transcript_12944/m.24322 type:complete len:246 (-) Transcript_12944:134-871(-)|eukprot:CAMPEP_0176504112 /NCGR_PEP_ID=MMETSP0200_2-20121128/15747_1 /TAXON_ID=947934 /ORGANISM="Chaetoceros sp., Strain GSL56" /LENGTH=245 /DNA_ID=CAMNT_0017903497 /DNA_START=114 /DNA_END=851 /DNA_ORIENTATION=+
MFLFHSYLFLSPLMLLLSYSPTRVESFTPSIYGSSFIANQKSAINNLSTLNLFDKLFEEEGPLGKGITVGKVQLGLSCSDRSLIETLEKESNSYGSEPEELSGLCNAVCLTLLRRQDDWISACSESKWFSQNDAGKAESLFNLWSNEEAAKFEKEYFPSKDSEKGGPTNIVVSLVVEIQGDETNFSNAGFSRSATKDVLTSIASDCMVDDGYCLNAVEVFWTPGDREEVLTKNDIILDFPTLIDL